MRPNKVSMPVKQVIQGWKIRSNPLQSQPKHWMCQSQLLLGRNNALMSSAISKNLEDQERPLMILLKKGFTSFSQRCLLVCLPVKVFILCLLDGHPLFCQAQLPPPSPSPPMKNHRLIALDLSYASMDIPWLSHHALLTTKSHTWTHACLNEKQCWMSSDMAAQWHFSVMTIRLYAVTLLSADNKTLLSDTAQ